MGGYHMDDYMSLLLCIWDMLGVSPKDCFGPSARILVNNETLIDFESITKRRTLTKNS